MSASPTPPGCGSVRKTRRASATTTAASRRTDRHIASEPSSGSDAADAALAAWGDRMPSTRKEAIQALGIGTRRGTADAATIKRIVDALRKNWHPDRAKDESDRQLRELRSKQINAAWDLLQRERAEA